MLTGIRILPGATLTISGNNTQIHLPKDGQIIIEPGGQLLVDGATLTNGCKDCLWGGIVATGNSHLPQTPANQATVIVRNNALIEHARNAITTWGGALASAGAILNLTGSTFRNNHRSIEFISYHNTSPTGQTLGNQSRIRNCTFQLDDHYRGTAIGYYFTTHASLWDVEGVVLAGNSFSNTNSHKQNFGNAITSFNAAYQLLPVCPPAPGCPTPQQNTFSGFKHAVEANGDNLTGHTFRISRATFDRCAVGVYARTNNHFAVENSTFTIGNAPFDYTVQCSQNFGIRALDYCDGIRVAGNTFAGTGSTFFRTLGVSLERTGQDNKEVHGNRFSGLNYGVFAEGQNGFLTNYQNTGALITCNQFMDNEEAITVNWRSSIHSQQSHQGYSSGNTFSAGQLIANYNTPGTFPIQYFHHGGNAVPNAYQFQLVGPMPQLACSTASPEYPQNPIPFFHDQFTQARAHHQDLLTAYTSRIDGGETQVRIGFIQSGQ